jgi:hypothetical protein
VAIGVVVIGQLFGFIGLFVAVPILSLIVIAVDELWVKPLEREQGLQVNVLGGSPASAAASSERPDPVPRAAASSASAAPRAS